MKQHTIYPRIYALVLSLVLFIPLNSHADIGIVAIAVDATHQEKGAFETNAGINVGDVLSTGAEGNLTILFDDESMLTLGPNTKAVIVKYSETPAPGVSEVKIISGSFNYFPGTILENGGQQVLLNLANLGPDTPSAASEQTNPTPTRQASQTNTPTTLASSPKDNTTSEPSAGEISVPLDSISTADLAVAKPTISLVVASSGANDGGNGGNTSVFGVEMDEPAMAAPELTFMLDPAFHIETSHEGPHLKAGTDNGHVPHS